MEHQNLEISPQSPLATTPPSLVAQPSDDGARTFVAEARSIQALLQEYQQRNESLKEDLSGFVHREIDEHAKLLHLRAAVDQAELSALRDSKYLEYVAKHTKQEQTRNTADASPAAVSADTAEAQREQITTRYAAGLASKSKTWWAEKLEKCDSARLRSWLPDRVLALNDEESVMHVWLGWKSVTSKSTEAFNSIVDRVYSNAEATSVTSDKALNCFGNGFLCTTPVEADSSVLTDLTKKVSFIVAEASRLSRLESCEALSDSLARRIAWMTAMYSTELHSATAMSPARFFDCMWPRNESDAADEAKKTTVADGLRLCGDGRDTLVFVDPERLRTVITIRGFFFHGDVGLVEQLGAEVDMTALCLPNDVRFTTDEDCRTWVRSAIVRTLRALYAILTAHVSESENAVDAAVPTNLVLTVALHLPATRDGLFDGVLLDARPISPQLAFEGRTTWMEVCAVGRQRDGARSTVNDSKISEEQNAPTDVLDNVVFRLAYLPVASLQPYDAVSQQLFPYLNEAIKSRLVGSDGTEGPADERPNKAPTLRSSPTSFVTVASVCVGTAFCVTLAVGVVRWIRRS